MASKTQASKRSRKHKKQAKFSKLKKNFGHPSHLSHGEWARYQKRFQEVPFGEIKVESN